ncbi:hypothetical protein F4801DRAFT_531846 [Xylaria longipes]|nr:hypothetical protein F4801DRAFT_531846 [Xylaria longipes]
MRWCDENRVSAVAMLWLTHVTVSTTARCCRATYYRLLSLAHVLSCLTEWCTYSVLGSRLRDVFLFDATATRRASFSCRAAFLHSNCFGFERVIGLPNRHLAT